MEMSTYTAKIDNGQGGETTITADTAAEALVEAIEWAKDGDWPDEGCEISVSVENDDDEDDTAEEDVHIESEQEKLESELSEDGEVLAEQEGEWSTTKIIRLEDDYYEIEENGGSRGAWNRQCGDGVWREHPVRPATAITRSEARARMLDLGVSPAAVVRLTR